MMHDSTTSTAPRQSIYLMDIWRAVNLLHEPGAVVELRVLKTRQGTISGYFDDFAKLAQAADKLSGTVPAVYVTLNPTHSALLARANNRIERYARTTTSDGDIVKRCWLPIDFDPARPADISATDAEKALAMDRARQCGAWLANLGFSSGLFADSGNGAHLLYRVDLPNDPASAELVKKCLEALAARFTDGKVAVDVKNFNAARIWKLYGTLASKGDDMPDRPHRRASIIEGKDLAVISLERLQQLASLAPEPENHHSASNGHYQPFNLDDFIARHGISVKRESDWNGGRRFILEACPWNPDHNRGEAFIVQLANGAIGAGCQHNSCAGKGWTELRDIYEPGYRDHRNGSAPPRAGLDGKKGLSSLNSLSSPAVQIQPTIEPAAFYGLAGDIVEAIAPHSESDPVAILVNLLTGFGSLVGSGPHHKVEKTAHNLNVFVVQVGKSSKGRKGTAWSMPKFMLQKIDQDWGEKGSEADYRAVRA